MTHEVLLRLPPAPNSSAPRYLAQVLLLAVASFAVGKLVVAFGSSHEQLRLLWVPSGIGVAALFLGGLRLWPGVVLGPLALAWAEGYGVAQAAGLAGGSAVEALLGAWLLARMVRMDARCERLRDVLGLALAAVAAGGVGSLLEVGGAPVPGTWNAWWMCWLARALGIFLVAPVMLAWLAEPRLRLPVTGWVELASVVALTLLVSFLVFGSMADARMVNPLPYALFPVMLWGALRFGQREVSAMVLIAAAVAVWGTAQGNGPFMMPTPGESLASLYLFLAVVAVAALALTAAMRERAAAEERARSHLQQLARVSRVSALGEMASAIAHEINQPLAAIMSYTQACQRILGRDDADREEVRRAMERVAAQAERAGEIIRRLRGLMSRDESRREAVDVNHLVREVAELMRGEARQGGVQLRLELDPLLPPVQADGIQVQQVILNLLRNGIEAVAGLGGPEQAVTVTTLPAGDRIRVTVRDTGHGLPPDGAEKIFEPFYTTKAGGMGIGLAISRSIAEAHSGRLWAETGAGGAAFHLELPVAPEEM